MRIVERSKRLLICLLACWSLVPCIAVAHPVAQGALEIVVFPQRISVTARVSMEEVLVAAAYGGPKNASAFERVRAHGEYLLAHLLVAADGRQLAGRVVRVPEQVDGRPVYELEYRLPGGGPARIVFQQNALREFEFAPGNPWEASYVVRISRAEESTVEGLLLASGEPLAIDLNSLARVGLDKARLAKGYVRHGIMHILSGYDHLLFIAALALAVATLWDLVKVVSAFTLAHSITLTLSVLNIVRLSESIVEPMIAGSIVFVALQNVIVPERSRGAGRLWVAFFFGLFHGLGFAGGLLSAMEGMAGLAVGLAIAAFSLGVEVGHQIVALPIFFGLSKLRDCTACQASRIPGRVLRYGSAGICVAGMFYLIAALRWA
ncbi:MAG TPA: HupE/UreJ family protein [Candidatus Binatia bacterium]|nr:HupE/UreJ family protein [Candidatus Binatia bacterium]